MAKALICCLVAVFFGIAHGMIFFHIYIYIYSVHILLIEFSISYNEFPIKVWLVLHC